MSFAEDGPFNDRVAAFGNRYAAVQSVMKRARKKMEDSDYHIQESEAVTWAMRGTEPRKYNKPNRCDDNLLSRYEHFYIKETLCNVDDSQVCEAVRASYIASKQARELIYEYRDIFDSPRQARVRILARILWYNITE